MRRVFDSSSERQHKMQRVDTAPKVESTEAVEAPYFKTA
jgi:hypothetical protein